MLLGNFKERYAADEALWQTPATRLGLALLIAGIIAFPFLGNSYHIYIACLIGINVISATGVNILTGFTGLISLGHAAFMGVGAYAAAWYANHLGLPFYITLPLAGLTAAAVGMVVGVPSLRIKGLYLAIATLAAQFILGFVFNEWEPVTGGGRGVQVPPASIGGIVLDTEFELYYLIAALMVPLVLFARNLFRTRVGRAFIAIRDRDLSAELMGIDLLRFKLMSFGLSAFYAGVAGGLMAYFFKVVTPEQFGFDVSIFYLAAIVVGGMGTILGGVLGALFMTLVPEVLSAIVRLAGPDALALLSPVREIVFGVLIVGFLIFEPRGLAAIAHRARRSYHLWPFRR